MISGGTLPFFRAVRHLRVRCNHFSMRRSRLCMRRNDSPQRRIYLPMQRNDLQMRRIRFIHTTLELHA